MGSTAHMIEASDHNIQMMSILEYQVLDPTITRLVMAAASKVITTATISTNLDHEISKPGTKLNPSIRLASMGAITTAIQHSCLASVVGLKLILVPVMIHLPPLATNL